MQKGLRLYSVALALLLLLPASVGQAAREQFIPFGIDDAPSASAVQYQSITGNGEVASWTNTESEVKLVFPTEGQISKFWLRALTAPGASKTNTIKLRLNGADTSNSLVFSGTTNLLQQTLTKTSISTGDLVDFSSTPAGTPAASFYYGGVSFRPTNPNETVMMGSTGDVSLGNTLRYLSPSALANGATTESDVWTVIPEYSGGTYGTVTKFVVALDVAPGGVQSRTFTLRKNGADEAMSITISGTSVIASTTSNTFDLDDGDTLSVKMTTSGSAATSKAYFGIVIEPLRVGDYIIAGVSGGSLSTTGSAYEYNFPSTGNSAWTSTKSDKAQGGNWNHYVTSIGMKLSRAPNSGGGSGKSYEYYLENPSAGASRAHVVDAATYNNSSQFSWGSRMFNFLNGRTLAFGSPSVATAAWSLQMRYLGE